MASIEWQTALGYAEDSAYSARKPILFYYFDPQCIGCQQMDAATYSSDTVIRFVEKHLIPLRVDIEKKSSYERYSAIWTPTLIILDYKGHEAHRSIGFLNPDQFIAAMHLGIAKTHFSVGEYDTAKVHFEKIFNHFPKENIVPEAIFFSGVSRYTHKNDPAELKKAYEKLLHQFPDSSWTNKASPFRLL